MTTRTALQSDHVMYISITETVRYFNTRTMYELFVITKLSGNAIKHQSGRCVVFSILIYTASCGCVVQGCVHCLSLGE